MRANLKQWRRETEKRLAGKLIWSCETLVQQNSFIDDKPAYDPAELPWTPLLEHEADAIRAECEGIMQLDRSLPSFHELSPDQRSISNDERWKTFFLFGMGEKATGNCKRCPHTTRVLESIPGMTTAFFSILYPRKHVPPHRGVFKGFLRCHLGLVVPKSRANCTLRVADVTLHWEPGRCIVFDDTYEHEVHNDTDEPRVVLLIDVLRPMRYPGQLLTGGLLWMGSYTDYVKDARRNHLVWERRFERAWNESRQPR